MRKYLCVCLCLLTVYLFLTKQGTGTSDSSSWRHEFSNKVSKGKSDLPVRIFLLLQQQPVSNVPWCFQVGRTVAQKQNVRIVCTGRQGRNPLWVSVEDEGSPESGTWAFNFGVVLLILWLIKYLPTVCVFSVPVGDFAPKGCVTLMPYTLVTPHFPPVCRPILLLPSILGRVLDKKLAGWQGFQLLEPGKTWNTLQLKNCYHCCIQ